MDSVPLAKAAVAQMGDMDAFMQLLIGLAGTVQLDEKTRNIVFGQVLGMLSSEVARKASRPWQWLTAMLILVNLGLVIYIQNLMFLILVGGLP